MKYQILGLVVLAMGLAACGKNSSQNNADIAMSSAVAEAAGDNATVMGGVQLEFPHYVRSSNERALPDGGVQHRMNVEYIGLDRSELEAQLRKSVSAQGYSLVGPREHDGSFRYYVISGQKRVGAISVTPAGPALKVKMTSHGASGVVYMTWEGTNS